MIQRYRLHLRGTSFDNRPEYLSYLQANPNTPVWLERENNPYDANAIRAVAQIGSPVCIGYIPKEFAAVFAPMIDRKIAQLHLENTLVIGGGDRNFGCIAQISCVTQ